MKFFSTCLRSVFLFFLIAQAHALTHEVKGNYSSLRIETSAEKIAPGDSFDLALVMRLDAGWHMYGKDPGGMGRPTTFDFTVPSGVIVDPVVYPEPEKISSQLGTSFGYFNQVVFLTKVHLPKDYTGDSLSIDVKADWLVCGSSCVPNAKEMDMHVPVAVQSEYGEFPYASSPPLSHSNAVNGIFTALFFAFLGGIILNMMPCVFPVLSLKALLLMQSRESSSKAESLFYALGVLVVMSILAGVVIILKKLGHHVGWGFHMQSPLFVMFLLYLFFLLGLVLLGKVSVPGLSFSYHVAHPQHKNFEAFISGVLTTLAATPCTAPFMGVALGFAMMHSGVSILGIFLMLGLGIAFPFLILPHISGVRGILPSPGKWMETAKKWLSLPLFMTCVWLLWVLSMERGLDMIFIVGAGCFFMVLLTLKAPKKWMPLLTFFCLLGVSGTFVYVFFDSKVDNVQKISQKKYSQKDVDEALKSGKPVLVVATAAWCLTCKVNEVTLQSAEIQQKLKEKNVEVLIADWTEDDPEISMLLEKNGRSGVPFYIFYPGIEKKPILLSEFLTKKDVIKALES